MACSATNTNSCGNSIIGGGAINIANSTPSSVSNFDVDGVMNINSNNNKSHTTRDVSNVLQHQQQQLRQLHEQHQQLVDLNKSDTWNYDRIIDMMGKLDLQDDGISMNSKISLIKDNFCRIIRDENMLCELIEYINDRALSDPETAIKFALLFSSRTFDALAMNDTKIRCIMLKILETNYMNADIYRMQNKERLYNSITLLGEYYHRVRLADNSPICILGESLLTLLTREINGELEIVDAKKAKLILSQITLNGDIMRSNHKPELTNLFFHIRRNLIEQSSLTPVVKAILLMTLDLYYNNFAHLGVNLEDMYTKYLVQEDEDNNNLIHQQQHQLQQQVQSIQINNFSPQNSSEMEPNYQSSPIHNSSLSLNKSINPNSNSYENGDSGENIESDGNNDNSVEDQSPVVMKKWSEQVCEDSLLENELLNSSLNSDNITTDVNSEIERESHTLRRSNKPRISPRPLKQRQNINESNEEDVFKKPDFDPNDGTQSLPRWVPRYNHNNKHHKDDDSKQRRNQQSRRRFSANFDDDKDSVRSEGGSIRLYSINDRLKHSQEKIERSIGNHFHSIANSNWDRQSQHDDRSERSYISNYERGNYRRGGRGNYNNHHHRNTYDKPPRFQKHNQQQQRNQHHNDHQQQQNKDKIHNDGWRRRSTNYNNNNNNNQFNQDQIPDDNKSYRSNCSDRASTLPRPAKTNMDGNPANNNSYIRGNRRSHSPYNQRSGNQHQHARQFYNGRYSSHSSLASETSSTFERRSNNQNNRRNYQRHTQQQKNPGWKNSNSMQNIDSGDKVINNENEDVNWDNKSDNKDSELVRNARQTTKYMNYLSSKK